MNINTKYPLSKLTFGCEPLGGTDSGIIDLPEIRKAMDYAIERGINVFDVADVYGLGCAEKELCKSLGSKIHDLFIITKFGVKWELPKNGKRAITFRDSSPNYMIKALESSLKRLKIDTIPLYLVHWPDENTNIEETLNALEKAKYDGKIMNYGISNFFSSNTSNLFNDFKISAYQGPLNLVDFNRAGKIFKEALKTNITTFSYGPLAQGLLTGKFNSETKFNTNDRRSRLDHFEFNNWNRNDRIINALQKISIIYNKSISQIAIRWVIDNYNINSVIIGVKNRIQMESNLGALNFKLKKKDLSFINSIIKNNVK